MDDIRGLRETVPYAPTHGRKYKVFIIDEVHMLTPGAWNALLKTLEEPPPHVKFLFATTEAHKILDTIVSRCQRFDFKSIPIPQIVNQLNKIAEKEAIAIEPEALTAIARAADGGMRDAESIFDQIIAFCGGGVQESKLAESDVVNVFGLTSKKDLRNLVQALIENKPAEVITILNDLAENGRNLEKLYGDLLNYFRNLMIFHHAFYPQRIVEVTDSEKEDLLALKEASTPYQVSQLLEGLMTHEVRLRSYLNKRIFVEVTILRVMREANSLSINDIITQLRILKQKESFEENTSGQLSEKTVKIEPPQPFKENTPGQLSEKSDKVEPPQHSLDKQVSPKQPFEENTSGQLSEKTVKVEPPQHSLDKQVSPKQPEYPIKPSQSIPIAESDTASFDIKSPSVLPTITKEEESQELQVSNNLQNMSRREVWENLEKNDFVSEIANIFEGTIVDVRG